MPALKTPSGNPQLIANPALLRDLERVLQRHGINLDRLPDARWCGRCDLTQAPAICNNCQAALCLLEALRIIEGLGVHYELREPNR